MKERLDVALVKAGFFETRQRAKEEILRGSVSYNSQILKKPAEKFTLEEVKQVQISGEIPYVSRGGLKLEKAIKTFGLDLDDKIILDVGSSTGGFTDCALQYGAREVVAVDVGREQLHSSLKNDKRVISLEEINIKELTKEMIDGRIFNYIVMDLSFISISNILDNLLKFIEAETSLVILVKPQFEVGRKRLTKKGVVKDKREHLRVVKKVESALKANNLYINGFTPSPIKGSNGNVEYLILVEKKEGSNRPDYSKVIGNL